MAAKKKSEPHFVKERKIAYFNRVVQKFMQPWIFIPGYHYSTTFEDENYNLKPGYSPKASLENGSGFSLDISFFKEDEKRVKVRYVQEVEDGCAETLRDGFVDIFDRCAENTGAVFKVNNHRSPSGRYFSLEIRADTKSERKIDQVAEFIRTVDYMLKLYYLR